MKKNLIFIIPSLNSGGAEKSLVTLLSLIDRDRYNVDLLLFRNEGLFAGQIPGYVNVIEAGEDYLRFDGSFADAERYYLSRGKLSKTARRLLYSAVLYSRDTDRKNRLSWKYLSSIMPKLPRVYDVSIGFLEGHATYYSVDKITAAKHIGWLHIDYDMITSQKNMDEPYYRQLDYLVGVSQKCCEKAEREFPFLKGKTVLIENIISRSMIESMAAGENASDTSVYNTADGETVLLTIGRLSPQKGLDIAIPACAEIKRRGRRIKWYLIGRGALLDELKALAVKNGVENDFVFLGEKANPYPYIRQCDIYVQPSRFEGKSIAIDEVKCLAKPIVVTNFSTVVDQITDGVNGLIAEMTPGSVADKVCALLDDAELKKRLCENLINEDVGNEDEINKLYRLIEEG